MPESTKDRATWLDLAKLPVGAEVEFIEAHDISMIGRVPRTSRAVVKVQDLNELHPTLWLKPLTNVGLELTEYDGLMPLDPGDADFDLADQYTPAPLTIVNRVPA